MNLLNETVEMLKADKRSYAEIAAGADVKRDWLQSLALGRIADPGITKIQRLNAFLRKTSQAA